MGHHASTTSLPSATPPPAFEAPDARPADKATPHVVHSCRTQQRFPQAPSEHWIARAVVVYTIDMMIIESFRTHRHSRRNIVNDPEVLTIRRGYRIRLHNDEQAPPWKLWNVINISRFHALAYQCTQRLVFTGNSALLLHGIPTWSANPDVEVWPSETRLRATPFHAVRHPRTTVPRANIISRARRPRNVTTVDTLEAESPIEAAVRLALNDEPLTGFVATCMVMHTLSRFDRFDLEESRRRCERIREEMHQELSRQPHHPHYLRAHTVLRKADGGCDNVFEAAILWFVNTLYSGRIVTQLPITVEDHTYFGDIVLPELKLMIEPDGRSKFGSTDEEVRDNTNKWLKRQHELVNDGWRVIRVSWHSTDDFGAFREYLATQLAIRHLKVPQDCLRLWLEQHQMH